MDDIMLKIAICDDNALHLEAIRIQTENCLNLMSKSFKIDTFTSSFEMATNIDKGGFYYDIAILDIDMNNIDGISLAKLINITNSLAQIIFVTSFIGYAPDTYETIHTYFVLKSSIENKLPLALNKAIENIDFFNDKNLTVLSRNKHTVLSQKTIVFIERNLRNSVIYCISDESYISRTKLEDIFVALNNNEFVQCHKSYIVNFNYVRELCRDNILLVNGINIPISRAYTSEVKKGFGLFIGNSI